MVVDSVAEEHSLGIGLETCPIFRSAVSLIILKNSLKRLPYPEIMLVVLHPDDITTIFGSLCQMIYIFLLLERKIVPSGNIIPHDLEIRKFIHKITELTVCRLLFCRLVCT